MRALPVVVLVMLVPLAARAQNKPVTLADVDARLSKLEAQLDELRARPVDVAALEKTVGELAAQVAALRQDLDRLGRAQAGQPDLVARLDALDAKVAALGEQVSSTRADLESRTGPESVAQAGEDGVIAGVGLRVSGLLQLRYQLRTDEAAGAGESFPRLRESDFLLRRARLGVGGRVYSRRLAWQAEVEAGQGQVRLLEYFVDADVGHGLYARAGRFKLPFSHELLVDEADLAFAELPVATEELGYERDLGLLVGWRGLVDASVGVFNGGDNLDPVLVGRVQYTRDPWLVVGVSGTFENAPVPGIVGYGDTALSENAADDAQRLAVDVDMDGRRDNVRVLMVGGDLGLGWRRLGLQAELYARQEDWGAIADGQPGGGFGFDPDRWYVGGFVQATYFVLPERLQLGARASRTQVSPILLGRARDEAPVSDARREWTALVAYRRWGHGLVVRGMYSFLDWEDATGVGEHRVVVEGQVGF
jgi:Phosphate-selective porin O and P